MYSDGQHPAHELTGLDCQIKTHIVVRIVNRYDKVSTCELYVIVNCKDQIKKCINYG